MTDEATDTPKWIPLEAGERRVLGVLVEKAKTTPDAYPLTLKGLVTGSNQKSNRFPQMTLDEDQVEEILDSLRTKGAVAMIQGDGRVEKFRHLAYDWLGVSKVELAVMAELLLRGAQTVGELRGRAARMEPIKGMAELAPLLESLQSKSLLLYLTPPGRGAVVTHSLYQPRELEKVCREHGVSTPEGNHTAPRPAAPPLPAGAGTAPPLATPPGVAEAPSSDQELAGLREEVAHLRNTLVAFQDQAEANIAELQQQVADLKSQLGV